MSMKRGHPFTLSDIRSAQAQYLGSEPMTRFQQSLGHCVNRFTTQHGHQQSTARFFVKKSSLLSCGIVDHMLNLAVYVCCAV